MTGTVHRPLELADDGPTSIGEDFVGAITADGATVWAGSSNGAIVRLDGNTSDGIESVQVSGYPCAISVGSDHIRVASTSKVHEGALVVHLIDRSSGATIRTDDVGSFDFVRDCQFDMSAGESALWVLASNDDSREVLRSVDRGAGYEPGERLPDSCCIPQMVGANLATFDRSVTTIDVLDAESLIPVATGSIGVPPEDLSFATALVAIDSVLVAGLARVADDPDLSSYYLAEYQVPEPSS